MKELISYFFSDLFQKLDNTFLGTFSAGLLLACFALYLYRRHKQIDTEVEDQRKNRELATSLLSYVEIMDRLYENEVNLYTNIYQDDEHLKKLIEILSFLYKNTGNGDSLDKHTKKSPNIVWNLSRILKISNELSFRLKAENRGNNNNQTVALIIEIPFIIHHSLLSMIIFPTVDKKTIKVYKKEFDKHSRIIKIALQEIIQLNQNNKKLRITNVLNFFK